MVLANDSTRSFDRSLMAWSKKTSSRLTSVRRVSSCKNKFFISNHAKKNYKKIKLE